MENFPIINELQVVLVRACALTGHVMNEEFEKINGLKQKMYTVFDSYDDALLYIQQEILHRRNIEAGIYDCRQKQIHYYNPFQILK
jgi:hypothetical protein